jgi:hypothetical protein
MTISDKPSLVAFIKSGSLGPIEQSMNIDEIQRFLGKPNHTFDPDQRGSSSEDPEIETILIRRIDPNMRSNVYGFEETNLGNTNESYEDKLQHRVDSYGCLEITSTTNGIHRIKVNFSTSLRPPTLLNIDWFDSLRHMNLLEFKQFLMNEKLPCHRLKSLLPDEESWVVNGGELIIIDEPGAQARFDHRHRLLELSYSFDEPLNWRLEDCH